jgi:hypothetical protein
LTGRIPNLQFYSFTIELDCTDFEVDTDGGDEGWSEGVVGKTEEKTAFADTWRFLLIIKKYRSGGARVSME